MAEKLEAAMQRLRSTLLTGSLLAFALVTAGCGGDSANQPEVTTGGAGAGMDPGRTGRSADPTMPTPGRPMTGSSGAPAMPSEIPPSHGASPNPPPMPDSTTVPAPGLTPVDLLPGTHARVAAWKLAGREGARTLLLDVQVGGAPCDAVTDVDVRENAGSVVITVHAGVVAFEGCGAGVPARLGVVRVRAHLDKPLGARRLLGG
jgi:hypothetical protein